MYLRIVFGGTPKLTRVASATTVQRDRSTRLPGGAARRQIYGEIRSPDRTRSDADLAHDADERGQQPHRTLSHPRVARFASCTHKDGLRSGGFDRTL